MGFESPVSRKRIAPHKTRGPIQQTEGNPRQHIRALPRLPRISKRSSAGICLPYVSITTAQEVLKSATCPNALPKDIGVGLGQENHLPGDARHGATQSKGRLEPRHAWNSEGRLRSLIKRAQTG